MHRKRANAAITALSLSVVLGFGALAVDVAYVRVANAQLQASIDAAALSASGRLDGTDEGLESALALASEITSVNPVVGGYLLEPDELVFGAWSPSAGFEPTLDAPRVNAVRVEARHKGLNAVLAGAAFGKQKLFTQAATLAVRDVGGPASAVECYLPLALPNCEYQKHTGGNPAPFHVTFGNDKTDNIGWAHAENATKPNIEKQLDGFCDPKSPLVVGEDINVNNGQISNQITHVSEILNKAKEGINYGDSYAAREWPYDTLADGPPPYGDPDFTFGADSLVNELNWGTVLAGPIAITNMPCDDPKFKGDVEILGFTYAVIYDVRQGSAHEAGFMIQLDTTNEYDFGTGTNPEAPGNVIAPNGPPRLTSL